MRRGLAGIEPTPARPYGAGYARFNLSANMYCFIASFVFKVLKISPPLKVGNMIFSHLLFVLHPLVLLFPLFYYLFLQNHQQYLEYLNLNLIN